MSDSEVSNQKQGGVWISSTLADLEHKVKSGKGNQTHFDVLIVGSGYGGSIAAHALSRFEKKSGNRSDPVRIGMLERGLEYTQGSFPNQFSELPGHVRFTSSEMIRPAGNRTGLFDLRMGPDIGVVLANGLGGGSLINAGVMVRPSPGVFGADWPNEISEDLQRDGFYSEVERLLGVSVNGQPNTIERHACYRQDVPLKYKFMRDLAVADKPVVTGAPISVAMENSAADANAVALSQCKLCGDCATGCNHNAKKSLDNQLLARLSAQKNVEIYTGATVLRFRKKPVQDTARGYVWSLLVTYTDATLRNRLVEPVEVLTENLVLAAGTLGSTEIIIRSQNRSDDEQDQHVRAAGPLRFSGRLGKRFSGNGDMIAFAYGLKEKINAIATETDEYDQRNIGPTITGIIDLRDGHDGSPPLIVEEMAVPGPLRRALEETLTTLDVLHTLAKEDGKKHVDGPIANDPAVVDPGKIERTSIFAVMGDDGAGGELFLDDFADSAESSLQVCWPGVKDLPLFEEQVRILNKLLKLDDQNSQKDGRLIPNPLWKLLPEQLQSLFGIKNGPLLTVHPLGGCAMGNSWRDGVVDHLGRVFDADAPGEEGVHAGLVVLDGSIVPTALGINPALTIAMLALRAMRRLPTQWGYSESAQVPELGSVTRAVYRKVEVPAPVATAVRLTERLSGPVVLRGQCGSTVLKTAEMTLYYQPKELQQLFAKALNGEARQLHLIEPAGDRPAFHPVSKLRIFDPLRYREIINNDTDVVRLEQELSDAAELEIDLCGHLEIMSRKASTSTRRKARALWAWVANRGTRDLWQLAFERAPELGQQRSTQIGNLRTLLAFADHAGEERAFHYRLRTSGLPRGRLDTGWFQGGTITASKQIVYRRKSNPWRQLSELRLETFPGLVQPCGFTSRILGGAGKLHHLNVLKLDTRFLARRRVPLFEITAQQDEPGAFLDLVSLLLYMLRVNLLIHFWSFRLPDLAPYRKIDSRPGILQVVDGHQRTEIEPVVRKLRVPYGDDQDRTVKIRLTRYPRPDTELPPVLLIHGYSVSANTFTHSAVDPNLAAHFWKHKRDVWVVDLRTSSALPTARKTWTFEQVASQDIPRAIAYIFDRTGRQPIDVVAHCMGAAMLSMSILGSTHDSKHPDHARVAERIRRVVLSQVGPVIEFSPDNRFRSFVLSYLLPFITLSDYNFRVEPDDSMLTHLYDRFLSSVPYEDEEILLENPWLPPWKRLPWVGTRHRMDALYGRTFELANLSDATLQHIDDLFGALDLNTLAQVMHFSRNKVITNREGKNVYTAKDNLVNSWHFKTLYVHGERNGLVDVHSVQLMEKLFEGTGLLQTEIIPGMGHQDCLIGKDAESRVFTKIERFLREPEVVVPLPVPAQQGLVFDAYAPEQGPVIEKLEQMQIPLRLGARSDRGMPDYIVAFPMGGCAEADLFIAKPPAGSKNGWLKGFVPRQYGNTMADRIGLLLLYRRMPSANCPQGKEIDPFDGNFQACEVDGITCSQIFAMVKPWFVAEAEQPRIIGNQGLAGHVIDISYLASVKDDVVRFALGSCQYPMMLINAPVAYDSYARLRRRLDHADAATPSFLVLVGDQIYVDSTAGLFDPKGVYNLRARHYEQLFSDNRVQSVLRRRHSYMMLDDHEIDNDWQQWDERIAKDTRRHREYVDNQRKRRKGVKEYLKYQRGPAAFYGMPASGGSLWYRFEESGFPFFMADTRTNRRPRSGGLPDATIFGERQRAALTQWLDTNARTGRPLFVASPSALVPRQLKQKRDSLAEDVCNESWCGYPASMRWLLQYIVDHEINNLVFLSGDEHVSCIARAEIKAPNGTATIHSVHSSALYAPFPFANSQEADLMANETFSWDVAGQRYSCEVQTRFAPPGDGFALISVCRENGNWQLDCEFDRKGNVNADAVNFDQNIEHAAKVRCNLNPFQPAA